MPTRRPPRSTPAPSRKAARPKAATRRALQTTNGDERSAAPFVPQTTSVSRLATAAQACRGCDLYARATQAVFGRGPKSAQLLLVGEQPGDQEDVQGEPFVGPAGAMLDKALAAAGISRDAVFLTNAVKHFKWEFRGSGGVESGRPERGKRRLHKKPRASEMRACRPWLEAELRAVRPTLVVCLGAVAAQSVIGPRFRLMQERGRVVEGALAARVVATIHPSAVLRAPDPEARRRAYSMLVSDLKTAARATRTRVKEGK